METYSKINTCDDALIFCWLNKCTANISHQNAHTQKRTFLVRVEYKCPRTILEVENKWGFRLNVGSLPSLLDFHTPCSGYIQKLFLSVVSR